MNLFRNAQASFSTLFVGSLVVPPFFGVLIVLTPVLLATLSAPLTAQIVWGLPDETKSDRNLIVPGLPGGSNPLDLSGDSSLPGLLSSPVRKKVEEIEEEDPIIPSKPSGGLYDGGGGYVPGNYYSPGAVFGPAPRKTRAQIVEELRQKSMMEKRQVEAAVRRLEVETGTRDWISELFGERSSALPQVLRKGSTSNVDAITPNTASKTNIEIEGGLAEKRQIKPPTEEELAEREHQRRLEEIAKLNDPEERKRRQEFEEQRQKRQQEWIERRREAERGALFFQVHSDLILEERLLRDGKCLLFDGQTLFGWRSQMEGPYGGGRFTVEDGMICSDPSHPGLLYSTAQFGDMTLSFEYQADTDAEVFLLMRTPPSPRDLATSCYTIVLNSMDPEKPRGLILGRQKLNLKSILENDPLDAIGITKNSLRSEERNSERPWRKLHVQFDAGRMTVVIDNADVSTLYDTKPLGHGYLGLLVTRGQARFRNMIWSPGSSLSIFDPTDPQRHWRSSQPKLRMVATRNASLQLNGGPGVVETKATYGNFILQLEYNIAFTSARTGLFFRSFPREEQTGYEISIQNFPRRADRDSIKGVDVGAFRDRKQARYVGAKDQRWNSLTLLVVGRQFQTWVNGIPVAEMSDRRPLQPDATPESILKESGPFLGAGTIQLLAPTDDTSVEFRNIRIMPILPRQEKGVGANRDQTTWQSLIEQRRDKERERALDKKKP